MFLQFGEVVEGISLVQFAGVDQAHEQVADPGAVFGFVKVSVFAVQDGLFQGSFANIIYLRRQIRLM